MYERVVDVTVEFGYARQQSTSIHSLDLQPRQIEELCIGFELLTTIQADLQISVSLWLKLKDCKIALKVFEFNLRQAIIPATQLLWLISARSHKPCSLLFVMMNGDGEP